MGLRSVREGAGDDTYLLVSSGPTVAGAGIQDGARVGRDYGEYMISQCADWALHRNVATNMSAVAFTHRNFYVNDSMNCLTVGEPCPLKTAQFSAGMFGLCGGPIMLGDDLTILSEERISLIEKCLPPYGEVARALDLFEHSGPDTYPCVLHLRVEAAWDTWDIVGLVNYGLKPVTRRVSLRDIGLAADAKVRVFDFWEEEYLGVFRGEATVEVAPRSMKILRFTRGEGEDRPSILATNMHVIQGALDLRDVCWNAQEMTLSGTALRTKGARGKVFVNVPRGWDIMETRGSGVKCEGAVNGVAALELAFSGREIAWAVRFGGGRGERG